MKKLIFIFLGVVCLLISCAGSKFIPEGSQSLGVYEGSFDGVRSGGTIRIHLFQTPEGDKLFRATIVLDSFDRRGGESGTLFVHGKITTNSLAGEFQGNASGTLSGQLSSDGNQLTGSFNLTDLNNGTWKAQKK